MFGITCPECSLALALNVLLFTSIG